MRKRLFVDMDGTLAEFKIVDTLETLFEQGYFYNLKPQVNVVNAVKKLIKNDPEIEVFILSAYLSDSKYALDEKNLWLDRYLPEIDTEHRFFVNCGEDKKKYISLQSGDIDQNDYLLDDYSVNLHSWEPPARGIKLMNGINGNYGTWKNERLSFERSSDDLAACIRNIMLFDASYRDIGPNLALKEEESNTIRYGR